MTSEISRDWGPARRAGQGKTERDKTRHDKPTPT